MKMVKYVILKTGKWEGSLTAPFIYPLGIWCAASRIALNNSSMFLQAIPVYFLFVVQCNIQKRFE